MVVNHATHHPAPQASHHAAPQPPKQAQNTDKSPPAPKADNKKSDKQVDVQA